jgi:uncharacterized hydantoinase/oxoprolinase family protein
MRTETVLLMNVIPLQGRTSEVFSEYFTIVIFMIGKYSVLSRK